MEEDALRQIDAMLGKLRAFGIQEKQEPVRAESAASAHLAESSSCSAPPTASRQDNDTQETHSVDATATDGKKKSGADLDELLQAQREGKELNKSQLKKLKKAEEALKKKEAKAAEQAAEEARRAEEAKKVTIEQDASLPPAVPVSVAEVKDHVDQRVVVCGWCHFVRKQGGMMFVEIRDGTGVPGLLQCVFMGKLARTYEAFTLAREASVRVYGTLQAEPRAKGGVELHADYWELVGASDPQVENEVNRESHEFVILEKRHLVLRQSQSIYMLKMHSIITHCLREWFLGRGFYEVTPPTLVQVNCEGGSDIFKLDYYGEDAYLTQSSQLYLETVVPALGKVFCVLPSYRAEKSRTRRHLAEFVHVEAELGFISFEDLLVLLEDMVVSVTERVMRHEEGGRIMKELNPDFKVPERHFVRMDYKDAIEYCNKEGILNPLHDPPRPFVFGEDITEKPEREMTDKIGRPILLCRFPYKMKAFYMSRCPEDRELTESVDVLMPGVGEIVGGSMRIWDLAELLAAYKTQNIDPSPYYWYTDQRKYGACPHGGWGLGLERLMCWILNIRHIRDVCMYPRFWGRCKP